MNRALLEYEMKIKGISTEQVCKSIGVSRSAFYRKCNGKSDFTLTEIKEILNLLSLTDPTNIFFADEVS